MVSYSFGAVPALSLAGAKFDFAQLQQECESQFKLVNLSLFYQCRALELPDSQRNLDFRDSRITLLFMFVPMGQSLFGSKICRRSTYQLTGTPQLKTLLPHGTRPAEILEQTQVSERISQRFKTYLERLSTAFFKVHLAGDENYRSYFSSSDDNKLSIPIDDQLLCKPKN